MWIGVVSIFPALISSIAEVGVLSRGIAGGALELEVFNPRDFTVDRHATVDDRPYGGGPGMVMKVQPLKAAIAAAKARAPMPGRCIYFSPQGRSLDQAGVKRLAAEPALIMLAGRYEGVDERLIDEVVDEEVSIGDYVVSGGELPAMVAIDAIARLLPGTLGNEASAATESHGDGLLDWPHYTRPETFAGREVPPVLLSGDHAAISRWRLKEALGRTYERRPDLMARRVLTSEERALLAKYMKSRGHDALRDEE
jgi:tRNA (guanine37-N1)-methyltransferase